MDPDPGAKPPAPDAKEAAAAPPAALFVAVGHQGLRIVSTDGQEWKGQQLGKEGEVYRAACFGNGRYVAVGTFGGSNIFASTADGATWQTQTRDGQYRDFVRGLGFGKETFVALGGDPGSVGSSSPFVVTSADGVKWSDYTPIAGKNILRRFAYGNGLFVGVGDRGRRAASKDGLHWDDAPNVKAIDTLIDVTFGKGLFVGVGLHGSRMTSEDGLKWSARIQGEEGEHLNTIVWADDRFVAVGQGGTYSSPDGVTWKREDNKDAPLTVAYGRKIFIGANWKGRILKSVDGLKWELVHTCDQHVEAVAFGGTA